MIKGCDRNLVMAFPLAEGNEADDDDFQQLCIRGSFSSQKLALKTRKVIEKQNDSRTKQTSTRCSGEDLERKRKKSKMRLACEDTKRIDRGPRNRPHHSEGNNSFDAVVSVSKHSLKPSETLKLKDFPMVKVEISTEEFLKETQNSISNEFCISLSDEPIDESNVSKQAEQLDGMLEAQKEDAQIDMLSASKEVYEVSSPHASHANFTMDNTKVTATAGDGAKEIAVTCYGSQMSALLRMCSLAVKEDKETNKKGKNSSCMEDFTVDADDSEDETDITSLMTQVTRSTKTPREKTVEIPETTFRKPMEEITNSFKNAGRDIQSNIRISEKKVSRNNLNIVGKRSDGNETQRHCKDDKTNESEIYYTDCSNIRKDNSAQNSQSDVQCPVCKRNISDMAPAEREAHSNSCLDSLVEGQKEKFEKSSTVRSASAERSSLQNYAPVVEWLNKLSLSKYVDLFIKEEIDWNTLQWIKEEDLINLGITALGPRRKIISAIQQLKKGDCTSSSNITPQNFQEQSKMVGSKLITDFFQLPSLANRALNHSNSCNNRGITKKRLSSMGGDKASSNRMSNVKRRRAGLGYSGIVGLKDAPQWMCIPGTLFRVDAFRYLTGDCSRWFLTHFHTDHYQGLTKGFRYGKIYCSSITARLVNLRIGIPWDRLQPVPLNESVEIDGVQVTFIDANHCPGSVMISFELPNGKNVLHTGDFRFCTDMANIPVLQKENIHTLMLDTTYCDPQYDFPKQEAVIQFVIDAIQAEAFNPNTLFLIGTYTIGKERLFLEVGKVLQKKVYVGAAKQRMLACMDIPQDDLKWLTSNDEESFIHVVPLWSIASFKRMSYISKHYHGKYNSIVGFSPTGWNFGRDKKRTPGRRWQKGTMIRYEVPYSEHCSYEELKEFVKFIKPEAIIPTVNNSSSQAADTMIAQLLSQDP